MKHRGYILFELVLALSLLAGLLVLSQQWMAREQAAQQRSHWQLEAHALLTAIEQFWLSEARLPEPLSELITKGYIAQIWQPWGAPWQLSTQANLLRLQTPAASVSEANWLAQRIAGADVSHTGDLRLHVWQPAVLALRERYLHRIEDPQHPQYSTMAADLNMNGYSVKNAGLVEAQLVVAERASAQHADIDDLRSSSLTAADLTAQQAIIAGYDVQSVVARLQQLEQQWQACRTQGGCQ